ncbi:Imm8 family immunity protein [Pyxidicoccus fallax]|uniref:Imm8 family immunity protein n=1 Tax=Pyxidicoccus fallax TaxID=394095 RepID=UPI003459CF17
MAALAWKGPSSAAWRWRGGCQAPEPPRVPGEALPLENALKPAIHHVTDGTHHPFRTWVPDNPDEVVTHVAVSIGVKTQGKGAKGRLKSSDEFTIMVATPAGLATLEDTDGVILANRKLVVLRRYDYDLLWRWLEATVASCEAPTWEECVRKLREHFHWEFDYVK